MTHIASIEASAPGPLHAHYAASKAAVVMHARSAALEYGPYGIRVNTVSPGLIDREGLAAAWPEGVRRWQGAAPLGRLGRPEDVGDACVFLASRLASWITGTRPGGGRRRHGPADVVSGPVSTRRRHPYLSGRR